MPFGFLRNSVHASHAGEFEALTPGNESIPYVSRYLGETQIVDGSGNVLARLTYEDGEGIISAVVTPQPEALGLGPIPDAFWTADLPPVAQKQWDTGQDFGKQYYARTVRPLLEQHD